jgi:hypothetical protein
VPRRRQPKRTLRKHPFYADSEIPADHRGDRRCRRCGVMGRPGDQRRTEEFPPVPVEDETDRITGERG